MAPKLWLYAALPQIVVVAIFVPLALITGDPTFSYLSIGLSVGIAIGNGAGIWARNAIIANVYGENWRQDLTVGKIVREAKIRAKNPTPPI
jgi:hypothetical protein